MAASLHRVSAVVVVESLDTLLTPEVQEHRDKATTVVVAMMLTPAAEVALGA
jgi:hypothetical protein